MARAGRIYRRLPGRSSGLGSYHRLWLGPDHLLSVSTVGWSEEYKRFYFRDIQALVTCQTDWWLVGNVIFGVLAGVLPLVGAGLSDGFWRGFWFVIGGVFLLFLLVNWAQGPTCICRIRSAVQTEELPTLKRLRRARKVIRRIRPLIEAAQGRLAPAPVPLNPAEAAAESAPRFSSEGIPPPQAPSSDTE